MSSREIEGCGSWKLPSRLRTISQDQPAVGRIARVSRDQDVVWRSHIYPVAVRIGPLQPRGPVLLPRWMFPQPQMRPIDQDDHELGGGPPQPQTRAAGDGKIELGGSAPQPQTMAAEDGKIELQPQARAAEDGKIDQIGGSAPQPQTMAAEDGKIDQLGGSAPPPQTRVDKVEVVIPLFARDEEKTKLAFLRSLILRGHAAGEETAVVLQYLKHIQGRIGAISERYESLGKYNVAREDLVEMMVLDGCFIIEVIVDYWMSKKEGALPRANEVVKSDLLLVENQIPFFVLEELFGMTVVPELGTEVGARELIRNLAVFYLTGGPTKEAPAACEGPIYHLLHLLHVSLRPAPPPIAPRSQPPLAGNLGKMKLLWRLMNTNSSNSPVDWITWRLSPPARELSRLGLRFKPKPTPRLADITFDHKNGVLEIPHLPRGGLHMHMLSNLAAMEVGDGWASTERLFCSYAMFMTELVRGPEDVTLLIDAGILGCQVEEYWPMLGFRVGHLALLNVGGGYQCHFRELVRAVKAYYVGASNVMRAMCLR